MYRFTGIILSALLVAETGSAQTLTDSITVDAQTRRALEGARQRTVRYQPGDETVLPGETGLFILEKIDIFSVRGGASMGFSSNPARNDLGGPESPFVSAFVDAGVDTRIDQSFDVGARFSLSTTQFTGVDNLSSTAAILSGYVGREIAYGVYAQADFNLGWSIANGGLSDATAFYGAGLSLRRGFLLHPRVALTPSVSAGYSGSEVSELESYSISGGAELDVLVAEGLTTKTSAQVIFREFPDFFESTTGVARHDLAFSLGVAASYALSDFAAANISLGYTTNQSSLDISDYDNIDGLLGASIIFKF
ncbi:MAG: hypothetical protein AAF666_13865 [Pseudomonadota bacterium]